MIDFKTPVLKRLKELAEDIDHPVFMVIIKDGTSYIDLYRKCSHGDGYPYYLKGITPKAAPEVSAWAAMAHILGIFDEVVAAAENP